MNELFGLPAHPLVVHGSVVLLPLASIGALACLHPRVRRRFGVVVAVLACLAAVFTWMAQESGHELQEQVTQTHLVHEHAEMGTWVLPWSIVLAVAMVAWVGFDEFERRTGNKTSKPSEPSAEPTADESEQTPAPSASAAKPLWQKGLALALAATVAVTAVGSTVAVIQVGHSGAKATWDQEQTQRQ